jgi:integrase/recombinase XerD
MLPKKMKAVHAAPVPTDYFTPDEFKKIVDGTYAYGEWRGGRDYQHRALRLRTLILVMRWSGLSILDAVTLERHRLDGNRLLLYRHKTKVPVFVPLPGNLVGLLEGLPNSTPRYFFWSGNGDPHTAKKGWQRSLRRLFKTVSLKTEDGRPKRCHPHMFRDTFAVELLLAGVPLDQVSLLLGHSSVKITEKHYAPFVKARQQQLEASVRMAWQGHRAATKAARKCHVVVLPGLTEPPMDAHDDSLRDSQGCVPTLKPFFRASPPQHIRLIVKDSPYGVFAQVPQFRQL